MNLQRLFKEWPELKKRLEALEAYCRPQEPPKVAEIPETPTIRPKESEQSLSTTPRVDNWRKRNRAKGN